MNKLKMIVGISFALIPAIFYGQNWDTLSTGVNRAVISAFADTINNKLYVGENGGGTGVNCLHVWNGSHWDTLRHIDGSIYSINKFQGNIVAANGSILKWDGSNWIQFGVGAMGLYNDNDINLYATGWFDTLGGTAVSRIAKWNGVSWSQIDTTHWIGGAIDCSIIYKGKLYIGGNFWDPAGTISRIARWDTTHWQSLGAGILGSSVVSCFEIYNNELYVGGFFSAAAGNPGTAIAKWDGDNWSDVGGGMSGSNARVYDLKVYNGYLYAAGSFSGAGNIPANDIARWDGMNWCSLGYNGTGISGSILSSAEVLNHDLYIAGAFTAINGDTMNHVSKWIGGNYSDTCEDNIAGIHELTGENLGLTIYPNPATDQITIEFTLTDAQNTVIDIKNTLGQTVKKIINSYSNGKNHVEINTSDLSNGLYFVQLQKGNQVFSKKIIKQ